MNWLVMIVCYVLVRLEVVGNCILEEINFDGGKKYIEDGQKEISVREVYFIIIDSGYGSVNYEGKQRSVGYGIVVMVVLDVVQEDGEYGGKYVYGLVEGNRDYCKRQVGYGDVGSEEGIEGNERQVFMMVEVGYFEVVELYYDGGVDGSE